MTYRNGEDSNELFRALWTKLSIEGACDSRGGAEFHRVFGEWIKAGKPSGIVNFIRGRANLASEKGGEHGEKEASDDDDRNGV